MAKLFQGKGSRKRKISTQEVIEPVSIHVTYIDTKRILPYQKGGDLRGFTKQFLQGFSDVLPPNVTSEQVKFQRYNARFDDSAELENGYEFDDNQKVSAHIVGDKKAKEKENRTPLNMSISGGQHTFYLYITDLAKSDNGFVGNSTLKFHQLTVGSTYRFWSAVSNKNGGVMKRSPSENIVICGGTFEEPDDTHIQVIDVNNKSPNKSNAVALLFTDTKLNKQYAMKGIGCGQEIQTEEISSHDDESDIFEPDYFWSYTMLKHVKTGCYVGCDYTGKVTLVENSKPEFPNAEILFIANAP